MNPEAQCPPEKENSKREAREVNPDRWGPNETRGSQVQAKAQKRAS